MPHYATRGSRSVFPASYKTAVSRKSEKLYWLQSLNHFQCSRLRIILWYSFFKQLFQGTIIDKNKIHEWKCRRKSDVKTRWYDCDLTVWLVKSGARQKLSGIPDSLIIEMSSQISTCADGLDLQSCRLMASHSVCSDWNSSQSGMLWWWPAHLFSTVKTKTQLEMPSKDNGAFEITVAYSTIWWVV